MSSAPRPTMCFWYNHDGEAAVDFYVKTFPDSKKGKVSRAPGDYPDGKQGDVITVEFTLLSVECMALNGGPQFPQTEAFSFVVNTRDQAETDKYWNAIVGNGGKESQCGWCKDKWGLNWQIAPLALTEAVASKDPRVAKRAFDAMMHMKKIDIAKIEAAIKGS